MADRIVVNVAVLGAAPPPVEPPVTPPKRTVWARVPSFGNGVFVQVYLRRLRDRVFSRERCVRLHPLI